MAKFLVFLSVLLLAACQVTTGFVVKQGSSQVKTFTSSSPNAPADSSMARGIFNRNKKEDEEDLSFLETRDMTRQEMERYNKRSEDIMNAELWGMTFFRYVCECGGKVCQQQLLEAIVSGSGRRQLIYVLFDFTRHSLVLSIPMLYLVYVGFFADTAGVDESLDITY